MKYSIRGSIRTVDGAEIVADINRYSLWRLITSQDPDTEGYSCFVFEAWLNAEAAKNALFDRLKLHVDTHTGAIDWHLCSHDEPTKLPCKIADTYTAGV